jgi:glycosyltransferase involved in cell wall biosynthesis
MKALQRPSLLFVFHEAQLTGASIVLLRYVKWLASNSDYKLVFILMNGGPLEAELHTIGEVIQRDSYRQLQVPSFSARVTRKISGKKFSNPVIQRLQSENFQAIIGNTFMSIPAIAEVKQFISAPAALYIHELELAENKISADVTGIIPLISIWIANSQATKKFIQKRFGIPEEKIVVNYPPVVIQEDTGICPETNKWEGKFVVGTSGTAMPRKGLDLFILLALEYRKKSSLNNFHFVWVGNNAALKDEIRYDIEKSDIGNLIEFTGEMKNPFSCYRNFDVFVSTSKEESFGLACAEAAALGKPVIGFENTGGLDEIIKGCAGKSVPYMHIDKMLAALEEIYNSPDLKTEMGKNSANYALRFSGKEFFGEWVNTIQKLTNQNQ